MTRPTHHHSSVMDAALDLILTGEMLAQTREEAMLARECWEARLAQQQDAYWARRDRRNEEQR